MSRKRLKKPITLYATPVELERLKAQAERSGMNYSAFVIASAVGKIIRPVPSINQTQWAELSRLASNLNQLARAANAGRADVDPALLKDTKVQLQAIRSALVGSD